jgi:hypothetical protein
VVEALWLRGSLRMAQIICTAGIVCRRCDRICFFALHYARLCQGFVCNRFVPVHACIAHEV